MLFLNKKYFWYYFYWYYSSLVILISYINFNYALIEIPDSVRVNSEIFYDSPINAELYEVEEFIDKKTGSIHLRVIDSTIVDDVKYNGITSYYRINEIYYENNTTTNLKIEEKSIISYSNLYSLCNMNSLDNWQLKKFTNIINRLSLAKELIKSDSLKLDRTAIGPLSLLKLLYENSNLLLLEEKAFDENRLLDMYYFQAKFKLIDSRQIIRLICLQPFNSIQNVNYSGDGEITLNMTIAYTHPIVIAIVIYDENENLDNLKPQRILKTSYPDDDNLNGKIEKLVIDYNYIQELSSIKHLGFKLGNNLNELNPFTLPSGACCGSLISRHNPLYIDSKQFSGLYDNDNINDNNMKYIAFDNDSNQLRLDSINEYKLIVDLKQKSLVYIRDSTNLNQNNISSLENFDNKVHCAQTTLPNDNNFKNYQNYDYDDNNNNIDHDLDLFMNAKNFQDILGLNKYIPLFYLGTTFFEDGNHCLVFEREVLLDQIPLLIKLNLILRLPINKKLALNQRFFLIFYIVDELNNNIDYNDIKYNLLSYESMWIKRIELISYNSSSTLKSKILYSRITFNEFVWSLESISDETRDRESKLIHPVRAFDLIECQNGNNNEGHQALIKLELLIKQLDIYEWQQQSYAPTSELNNNYPSKLLNQAETLEEGLMSLLLKGLRVSRSSINELEIIENPYSRMGINDNFIDNYEDNFYLILKTILTQPLPFKYELDLMGYIKSIDSIPFEKYGTFIKTGKNLNRFICQLNLASKFNGKKFFYIYCPNLGCGYIEALNSLNYINKDDSKERIPKLIDNFYMCEIHLLRKVLNSNINDDNYSPIKIQNSLKLSPISIDMATTTMTTAAINNNNYNNNKEKKELSRVFRGIILKCLATTITKTIASDNGILDSQAEIDSVSSIIKRVACFKSISNLTLSNKIKANFLELKLDLNQNLLNCDKSCQLLPNCLTYSYNKKTRSCILSNVDKNYFEFDDNYNYNDMIENLSYDLDCNIYETNPLNLYISTNSDVRVTTLNGLFREINHYNYFIINLNLINCAELCRTNEFNLLNEIHCKSFKYFKLISICVIEDKNNYLFEKYHGLEVANVKDRNELNKDNMEKFYQKLFGINIWPTVHSSHNYKRDFSQYYIMEYGTKIQLSIPAESPPSSSRNSIKDEQYYSKILFDLDLDSCLRECTIIDLNCVMVDYCFQQINSIPTRHCDLYYLRSPMSLIGKNEYNLSSNPLERFKSKLNLNNDEDIAIKSTLNDIEMLFYIDDNKENENYNITMTIDMGCHHFYLDGENLFLKRLIKNSKTNNNDNQLNDIANQDSKTSDNYLKLINENLLKTVSNGLGFLWTITIVISGLIVGIITTLFRPKFIKNNVNGNNRSINYFSTIDFTDLWNLFRWQRRERTNSTCSRLEMANIINREIEIN